MPTSRPDFPSFVSELGLDASIHDLRVMVEKVNPPPAPVHHRLLCRVEFPTADSLFKGDDYSPIGVGATSVAA